MQSNTARLGLLRTNWLGLVFGTIAMLALTSTASQAAAVSVNVDVDNQCTGCDDESELGCGVIILNAISQCCGQGNGYAQCGLGFEPNAYVAICDGSPGGCKCKAGGGDDCVRLEELE